MSILEGLAAFGGGFAEEATAYKTAQSNQLFKEQTIQLREAQLALLMKKTGEAQQTSPMTAALEGAAGAPPDPSTDPTALQYAPPAPAGGSPAGQTGQAPPSSLTPPAASGGALGGINQALQRGGQATPPTTQVSPPGQPAGAAGAGMPAPSPIGGSTLGPGDPLAQSGQQLQAVGQARMQAGAQPQVPPGPSGGPSFIPGYQAASQPLPATPVKTIPYGRGQDPGAAATQAPPPQDPYDLRKIPKGLKDLATPKQQAAAGIQPQPQQQKGTQVAQAGQWKPGQEVNPGNAMSWLRQKFPGKSDADYAKAYKDALPQIRAILNDRAREEQRAFGRSHQKFEEGLQTEKVETKKQEKAQHESTIKSVGEGIIAGDIPPDKIGWKDRDEVQAYIHEHGGNLSKLNLQWLNAKQMIRTLDSQQTNKFLTLSESTENTVDEAIDLSKKLGLSRYPDFNAWLTEYKKRGQDPNSPEGRTFSQYQSVLTVLKDELAQLAGGGYAPTESSWKQANALINENWAPQRMEDSLRETQKLLNFRRRAILSRSPMEQEQGGQQFGPYGYGQPQQQRQQPQGPAGNDPLGIR